MWFHLHQNSVAFRNQVGTDKMADVDGRLFMTSSAGPVPINAVAGLTKTRSRRTFVFNRAVIGGAILAAALCSSAPMRADDNGGDAQLDAALKLVLDQKGFTGRIEETLESRLGRPINPQLADLGRLLFFGPSRGAAQ